MGAILSGLASCVGSCAASCACSCVQNMCSSVGRRGSLFPYFVLLFVSSLLAFILRYWSATHPIAHAQVLLVWCIPHYASHILLILSVLSLCARQGRSDSDQLDSDITDRMQRERLTALLRLCSTRPYLLLTLLLLPRPSHFTTHITLQLVSHTHHTHTTSPLPSTRPQPLH